MKISTIIKYSFLTAISFISLSSCSDEFLDRKPLGIATEGEAGIGGAEARIFGLYSQLRTEGGVTDWTRHWFQSIRSDDAMKGSIPADASAMGNIMDNFQYSKTEGTAVANWNGHYKLIFACNSVIEDIETIQNPDAATLINLGEAKAMRAFAYFDLRRDYGEVPLIIKKVVNPQDEIKAKSSVAEVDALIKSDLQFAASVLPTDWASQKGRATRGMALSYLAKLALYQKSWGEALAFAETVINSNVYSLFPSYATLFTDAGDNRSESIWEVQFARINKVNYSNNYWESQGVRGSGSWDLGWGFNVPTSNLVNAYEPGDTRKNATILASGGPEGVPSSLSSIQPYWNKKAYTDPTRRLQEGENKNHWTNIKLMRYADVILMAAEAANETGNTAKAITYINLIRTRASLPNTLATTQAQLRDVLKQERRVEFGMEGERFYDLVRWGDAVTVLGPLGYQDRNKYFPIPQTAIDKAQGVLIQNPNY
ncbi:RagB/SusD family nutrient uptake outer membrane protein [Chryseobacterium profundimaris]|uniref:Starch-binding associating with outer membrane n=1 Tax=Chryseobacterium profundimaris TaxID=1387275 RepID=A0ABY1NK09_9FLAO|nr:RagB/SusD family nutrient uptake outer membrane protein [Chryseobacterium profundimaris]SMP11585.1 Starch-binding associating with outer membrane [Chryseobacterium profundimaris]